MYAATRGYFALQQGPLRNPNVGRVLMVMCVCAHAVLSIWTLTRPIHLELYFFT